MGTNYLYPKYFFILFFAWVPQYGFSNILLFIFVVNSFWSRFFIYKFWVLLLLHLGLKYSCWKVLKGNQLCIIISFLASGCVVIRFTQIHCYSYTSAVVCHVDTQTAQEEPVEWAESIVGLAGCCKRWHAVGVNGFKLRATQTENCLIKKKNWGEYWSMWRCWLESTLQRLKKMAAKWDLLSYPSSTLRCLSPLSLLQTYASFSTNYIVSYRLCYFLIPYCVVGMFS